MTLITTCQICGRDIKANTGVIAHHGYQRPDRGSGWQTASCFGARHKPYEVACDAIPLAIGRAKAWLTHAQESLAKLIGDPPPTITYYVRKKGVYWGDATEPVVAIKPEDFNSKGWLFGRDNYTLEFVKHKNELEYGIRNTLDNIAYLEKRLADWKPATEGAAA